MNTLGKHGKQLLSDLTVQSGIALCAVAVVVVALIACVAGAASGSAKHTSPAISEEAAAAASKFIASEAKATVRAGWAAIADTYITADALNNLNASKKKLSGFTVVDGGQAAELSSKQAKAINEALSNITSSHTAGVLFINLDTGKGLAYNLDARVYGASSFKGPYATYLCQHLADGKSGLSSSARQLMAAMITASDNDSFKTLRNTYDSSGFASWLAKCGVPTDIASDTHYPRYSARESALLWLRTYRYLNTNTDTAKTLKKLFKQTNLSFIRNGVTEVEKKATVMNKAGWSASGERFTGLCDAGLIEAKDGTMYLMSLMSDAPDGYPYTDYLADLAEALYEAKDALD